MTIATEQSKRSSQRIDRPGMGNHHDRWIMVMVDHGGQVILKTPAPKRTAVT